MQISLKRHATTMWVAQLAGSLDEVVEQLGATHPGAFWSLTSTPDEISLVSPLEHHEAFAACEGPWTLFEVDGPLDFGLTGILNSLTKPMADAGISIFAISTYDTDYILVKSDVADAAHNVWQQSGFGVAG
jgi:hypothetical protein